MEDYSQLLKILLEEEEELQFTQFTNDMSFDIGCKIVETAKQNHKSITVDIIRNGHQLFHAALAGQSVDNDDWVNRKSRVALRFGHSSHYMACLLKSNSKTLEQRYLLDPTQYVATGGAFPIFIKNVGIVGTITVSGMTSEEDHNLVTSTIRQFLK
ncbi:heme-degrading domain-containing protein [Paenibacillus agricola]|nr:heme-degrading domain-containing protein [Paenibacillus agricola]